MIFLKTFIRQFSLITLLSTLSISTAHATGAVVTIASATPIPTLSGSMLIILSLLLFVVAFKAAKQKGNNAGKFFIGLIGTFALVVGGSGIKLVTDVQASGLDVPLIPGTLTYRLINNPSDPNSGFYGAIRNNSGQSIDVLSIVPDANSVCYFPGNGSNPCSGNTIPLTTSPLMMPDGQSCTISCGHAASDIRLKQGITFLTELENGLKLYSFKYISSYTSDDTTYVGVMAQDLLNSASYKNSVRLMKNNYYGVNYHSLGLKMITLEQWKKSSNNIFIIKA